MIMWQKANLRESQAPLLLTAQAHLLLPHLQTSAMGNTWKWYLWLQSSQNIYNLWVVMQMKDSVAPYVQCSENFYFCFNFLSTVEFECDSQLTHTCLTNIYLLQRENDLWTHPLTTATLLTVTVLVYRCLEHRNMRQIRLRSNSFISSS